MKKKILINWKIEIRRKSSVSLIWDFRPRSLFLFPFLFPSLVPLAMRLFCSTILVLDLGFTCEIHDVTLHKAHFFNIYHNWFIWYTNTQMEWKSSLWKYAMETHWWTHRFTNAVLILFYFALFRSVTSDEVTYRNGERKMFFLDRMNPILEAGR